MVFHNRAASGAGNGQTVSTRGPVVRAPYLKDESGTQTAGITSSLVPVALIDATGVIRRVNEPWRRYDETYGLRPPSPGYSVSTNFLKVCESAKGEGAGAARAVADAIRRALQGELSPPGIDYPVLTTRPPRWFRTMATPIEDYGVLVMHIDITSQKLSEVDLEERIKRCLFLLDSTAEGIVTLEHGGICTFSNRSAAKMLGYSNAAELLGKPFHQNHHHSHPDGRPYPLAECGIDRDFRRSRSIHTETETFFRVDGTPFPVDYWSFPLQQDSGNTGTVLAFLDATEARHLEAQFLHAQRTETAGRLAEEIAHDLKNLIAVISGYGKLIEERLVSDNDGIRYARQIMLAADRAGTFTEQLLGHRKQLLRPTLLDLNSVVKGITTVLRRLVGTDVELTVILDSNLPLIEADAERLEQALMNLVVNARDAMPNGGRLVIHTSNRSAKYVTLSVSDNGAGMDSNTRSRMFEPFFTTKSQRKGTGLGLSTVQRIVNQMGGRIFVHSEVGSGTCFTIYIPVVENAPGPLLVKSSPRRGSGTILLIEKEESLRTLISDTLGTQGYRVLEAENVAVGLKKAARQRKVVALVLTDSPWHDAVIGNESTLLPKSLQVAPVLYLSEHTGIDKTHREASSPDHISKRNPFDTNAMVSNIRDALDGIAELSSDPQTA
jgi:PAS domain S-box-containing protein